MSVQERKRKEFLYLIQENKSVMEYDREFNKLSRFARSLVTVEKDRVERFLNGLRMSLHKDLSLFMLPTHAEALNKALKAEWMREMVNADSKAGEKKRPPQSNRPGDKQGRWENKKNPKYKTGCERCGHDHDSKECPWATGACF